MRIEDVILAAPQAGARRLRLRVLDGADELALFACTGYAQVIGWAAERVRADHPESLPRAALADLPIAEGDRLMAALYRAFFGERIELRQPCRACPESFELALPLADLVVSPAAVPESVVLPGGTRLRRPVIADLLAAGEGGDLLARVTLAEGEDPPEAVAAAAAALAPASIETIETACPHCGGAQTILFDLPRFVLLCTTREREILLREVHLLARTYGWGLGEVLSLVREDRHVLVRLATTTLAPRQRSRIA